MSHLPVQGYKLRNQPPRALIAEDPGHGTGCDSGPPEHALTYAPEFAWRESNADGRNFALDDFGAGLSA
jgi:hypothetical protein